MECIEPCHIKFDFLGKDSVRYVNTVEVHSKVYANVQRWIGRDIDGGSAPCSTSPPPPHLSSTAGVRPVPTSLPSV